MSGTLLLKHADLLITMDTTRCRIADGGLFVRDNEIVQAGPTAELPPAADTIIDARGMIGAAWTGQHPPPPLPEPSTRCIAQDSVLFDRPETLYPIWGAADAGSGDRLGHGRAGRADALRLHHIERSSLRLPQRLPGSSMRSRRRWSWASASQPRVEA